MKKKHIAAIIVLVFLTGIYFLLFHQNRSLKFIPENADVVILVDTKKAKRQYIFSVLTHPSKWFEGDKKDKNKISISDSGVKIPDFLQIFHLKNSKFSNYYTILELDDFQKFCTLLKKNQFINKGSQGYVKDHYVVYVNKKYAVIGTSNDEFIYIADFLKKNPSNKNTSADRFIKGSLGSLSLISGKDIQNFDINLNDDEIEIKNEKNSADFNSLISDLHKKVQFFEAELDSENIGKISAVFKENLTESTSVNHLKMSADLVEVNDTIVSYGYDDNFNEIEKVTYQKIVQPNYEIFLQTSFPDKTWNYFRHKKWINAQSQFTAIPFQPNTISQSKNAISIKSVGKFANLNEIKNQNFIFIRNNALLHSSFKFLNNSVLRDVEYVFYGNKSSNYKVKIKFKKEKYPLILR
jgi:hypothetical protein